MYLSRVRLQNWRSYDSAQFDFSKPRPGKPIVLVGAMNGHGKTSFLLALYLGIFGRYGLRYCEGFRSALGGGDDVPHYRRAIEMYRRDVAESDETTEIEVILSPTLKDDPEDRGIRIVRRWHFTSANKLKQGEFEELNVYVDGEALRTGDLARAHDAIEKHLFPAHVTPAFIFDGEQAQSLIERMGEEGLHRAVEVMYGTKVLSEARERLQAYVSRASNRAGGKRRTSGVEQELERLRKQREEDNNVLARKQKECEEIKHEVLSLQREQKEKMDELSRYGAGAGINLQEAERARALAEQKSAGAERQLSDGVRSLGLPLALGRLSTQVRARLRDEEVRENWEGLRTGTLAKKEEVIEAAMPEPAEADPLLGHLSLSIRAQVKNRLLHALERIYNPPPPSCAQEFLLGHIKGEGRAKVLQQLDAVTVPARELREAAANCRAASDELEEVKLRAERAKSVASPELELIRTRLDEIHALISNANRRIGELENDIRSRESSLRNLGAEIGRLAEQLGQLEPEAKRLALAESTSTMLSELVTKLEGTIGERLETAVTKQFRKIADGRYAKGHIKLPAGGSPSLAYDDGRMSRLEALSGFESRSFGVAFTLALAEIVQRRLPLVIDTPLGNADSHYRPRVLKALREFDLDQVIILTHDKEVTPDLVELLASSTGQKMLVEFDREKRRSIIHRDRFFGEST